jgi:hypothetical protein
MLIGIGSIPKECTTVIAVTVIACSNRAHLRVNVGFSLKTAKKDHIEIPATAVPVLPAA